MGHAEMDYAASASIVGGGGVVRRDGGWGDYWYGIQGELFCIGDMGGGMRSSDGSGVFKAESGGGSVGNNGGNDRGFL